jgi:hypothetical protein
MDRDPGAGQGSAAGGEVARDRLRGLLADAAGTAVAAGLMDGVGDGTPGHGTVEPVGRGRPADARGSPAPFMLRVCRLAVSEVGVSGAGVTVMVSVADGLAGRRDQIAWSGALSRQLEDLQLTAGQGPCLDAFAAGAPVLVGDLAASAARWPGFAPEALAAGAAAVFSLPVQVGAVRLGTLDLYRVTTGPLTAAELGAALLLAGLATETLLELAADHGPKGYGAGDGAADDAGWLADVHAEVHQASGVVSVAEHIGVGEALVRIRAHAYARGVPIAEVAARIIARELDLSNPDPDP